MMHCDLRALLHPAAKEETQYRIDIYIVSPYLKHDYQLELKATVFFAEKTWINEY
jgi:hypothetical protein